jgi:hypothetical protein
MPTQTTCPSCGRALRVPDHLIGQNVKCPGCQTTFRVEEEGPPPPGPPPLPPRTEDAIQEKPAGSPTPPDETFRDQPANQGGSPQLPPPPDEDLDEDELERDEEREYERRGRRLRERARERLAGPSIALMVTGGISLAFGLLQIVLQAFMGAMLMGGGPPAGGNDLMVNMVGGIIGGIIAIAAGAFIIFGAMKMKKAQSYGLALAASIVAMLDFPNCCCILGLPMGIWALIVLSDADVKAAFK